MSKREKEIWKPISGIPNHFISNLGNIYRTTFKSAITGDKPRTMYKKVLVPGFLKDGKYLRINIRYKRYLVHRLVAEAFCPNPDSKSDVNHIDGDPNNNRASNLEWTTRKENICHALRIGLQPTKLSENDVKEIRAMKGRLKGIEIANLYGVHPSTISEILTHKIWKHVI
jgi:hypothetical protein